MIYNMIWIRPGYAPMRFAMGDEDIIIETAKYLRAGARPELLEEFTVVSEKGDAQPLLEFMEEHDI